MNNEVRSWKVGLRCGTDTCGADAHHVTVGQSCTGNTVFWYLSVIYQYHQYHTILNGQS